MFDEDNTLNRTDSVQFVDHILQSLPELALHTKEDILDHLRVASHEIRVQWTILQNVVMIAEKILVEEEYDRLLAAVTAVSRDIDAYLEQREQHPHEAESLWSTQELSQFGTKGA